MNASNWRARSKSGSWVLVSCVVDRTLLEEQLAETERQVLEGERRIARQRQIVAELERGGQQSWDATELLRRLEYLQALHVARRDRLRNELGLSG